MGDIKLVVQSDDFGMCQSGNAGVVKAFTDGVLTQASVMVACPWFGDAVRLAKQHAIPTGVHLMATAEWDFFRWGPLTGGRSLVAEDGRFPKTIPAAQENLNADELLAEFTAQVELYRANGLEPEYFDCHMGIVLGEPYQAICRTYGKPFDYPIGEEAVGFDSIHMLSGRPSEDKVPYLLHLIETFEPGKHLIVGHCAVDSDELRSMTSDNAENAAWANEYRPSDLAALTASEGRKAIEARGIDLVSVGQL